MKKALDPFPEFGRTGTPDNMAAFHTNIEALAADLIAQLGQLKQRSRKPTDKLKAEDIRFIAYALIVYAVRREKPITERHLELLAAALSISRKSLAAANYFGISPVKAVWPYLEAADTVAREPNISDNELANRVGVSRKTVSEWRKQHAFNKRLMSTRYIEGVHLSAKQKATKESWKVAIDRVNREMLK